MRQPSIGRLIALMIGATVVLLLSIDTALACRLFHRRSSYVACSPVVTCPPVMSCPTPCATVYGGTSDCGTCSTVYGGPIYDSGCVDGCVSGCEGGDPIVDSAYEPAPIVVQPEEPTPALVPDVDADDSLSEIPADDDAEIAPAPQADAFDALPNDTDVVEPAIVEEPVDLDEPAADEPVDEFFAEPAANAPADALPDAAAPDDFFSDPAGEAPADVPTEEMPADDLDLFEQPADELPSDDDLFGTPAEDAADAIDDTFDPGDFESDADAPAFEEPATEEPPADEPTDSLDDLFGARPDRTIRTQTVATPVEKLPFRQWTDNTGRFKTMARLASVTETHVRLLKDNGRYSTVSKRRLSQDDLTYVGQMTEQFGRVDFDQVARR